MKKTRTGHDGIKKGLDAGERVAWLLRSIWDGNRAAMARDVGVSHTAINRVVSGERPPGRVLLTAISTHPKVNPGWLLTGEGDALLPEREETPIGGFAIPIAKRPLPGPPQEYLTLLSGEAFPVARPFYLPTRYWLEIQATDRIAGDVRQRVEAGDLLLIDTHLALRGDLDAVDGRLCIASRIAKKGTEFILGAVERQFETEEEPEGLMMDTFVKPSTFGDTGRDYLLHVPDSGQPSIRRTSPPRNALMENIKSIELQDIVGVCVLIVRRCT